MRTDAAGIAKLPTLYNNPSSCLISAQFHLIPNHYRQHIFCVLHKLRVRQGAPVAGSLPLAPLLSDCCSGGTIRGGGGGFNLCTSAVQRSLRASLHRRSDRHNGPDRAHLPSSSHWRYLCVVFQSALCTMSPRFFVFFWGGAGLKRLQAARGTPVQPSTSSPPASQVDSTACGTSPKRGALRTSDGGLTSRLERLSERGVRWGRRAVAVTLRRPPEPTAGGTTPSSF